MLYLMGNVRSGLRSAACVAAFALLAAVALPGAGVAPAAAQDAAAAEDSAPEAPVPQGKVTFPKLAICTDVQDRQPVGAAESFSSDVGHLYCFTHVVGAATPKQVFHRWYVGDRLVNEIPINVKGPSWRCWSRKTIVSSWSGACRVEIVSEEGDVLATKAFTLTGGASGAAAEAAEAGEAAEESAE